MHRHDGLEVDTCSMTLHAALDRLAARREAHPFVQVGQRSASYAYVSLRSRELAAQLTRLGGTADQPLVLLSRDPIVTAVAWFAASRLGSPLLPLNWALPVPSLTALLRGLDPPTGLVDADLVPILRQLQEFRPRLQSVVVAHPTAQDDGLVRFAARRLGSVPRAAIGPPPSDAASATDVALILGTSGSTGPPKRAILPHRYCLHAACEFASGRRIRANEILYSPLPMFHVNALMTTLLSALVLGATSAHDPKFSSHTFWDRARFYSAEHVSLIGSMLPRLHAHPATSDDKDNPVRTILTSPIRPELTDSFATRFGVELVFAYGQTEATPMIGPDFASTLPAGSTGRRNRWFDIALVGPDRTEVRNGEVGEIVGRPRSSGATFGGYLSDRQSSDTLWQDGWLCTGDLARSDGDCFTYVGRNSDLIRHAGENVPAVQVEAAFLGLPGVVEAAAHGVRGEWDEEIKVWIVPAAGVVISPRDVVAAAQTLPAFARPRYIEFAAQLPRTASDHLQRAELIAQAITPQTIDLASTYSSVAHGGS